MANPPTTLASYASCILICIGLEQDLEVEKLARKLPELAESGLQRPVLQRIRDLLLDRRSWGWEEERFVLGRLHLLVQQGRDSRVA